MHPDISVIVIGCGPSLRRGRGNRKVSVASGQIKSPVKLRGIENLEFIAEIEPSFSSHLDKRQGNESAGIKLLAYEIYIYIYVSMLIYLMCVQLYSLQWLEIIRVSNRYAKSVQTLKTVPV